VPGVRHAISSRINDQGLIRAHFAMVMTDTNSVMLSAWPAGAEENATANNMEVMAERDMQVDFEKYRGLDMDDLKAVIVKFVKKASVPANFTKRPLTAQVRKYIDHENKKRTSKLPSSYEHIKEGYTGTFVRVDNTTPIQTVAETKQMLTAIQVHSMRHMELMRSAL